MLPASTSGRAARAARLDPEKATGLALTLALAGAIVGGVVLAVLAVVVRSTDLLAGVDSSVAEWGNHHATGWSHEGLTLVTDLGETWMVVVVAVAVAAVELARTRNRWVAPFLLAVIVGDKVLTETIKQLVDRARPALEPVAATLGASFPSGHTSTAAASWAAFALVAGRWWGPPCLAGARRHRGRHRGRGRGQPRASRRPLADRRARAASHSAGPGSLPARSPSEAGSCASAPPRRRRDAARRRLRRATLPRPAESGRWS